MLMTWTFPFISRTPTDPCVSRNCYPPKFSVPRRVPYFPELPRLYIFNTLLEAACPSPVQGLVIVFFLMYQSCLVVCLLNRWLDLVLCIVYLVTLAVRVE